MPVNPGDHRLFSEADRIWNRVVRLAVIQGGGRQTQEYVQNCAEREANEEPAILPTPEELELLLTDINDDDRGLIRASLWQMEVYRVVVEEEPYDFSPSEDETDEEGSGIQFSPSQVDEILQTSARVEINTFEADELNCSICKLEYGTERGNAMSTEQSASGSDQGLPGEEAPEQPVKLSCGHIFGEWCIKTWLLEQSASCPICRFQFEPVGQ